MKLLWVSAIALTMMGCQGTGEKKIVLENQQDKVSYSIGLNIGANLNKDSIKINPAALVQGIKDAAADTSARLLNDKQVQETMMAFQQEMMAKQNEKTRVASEKNKKEGEAFLAENKKQEGVVTLPSGLQYKIISEGNGPLPKANQTVTFNYRGTHVDGTEFDSSFKRGQPATFPVTGVMPGWTEALQRMKVGSKWMLFVPSNLAYGEQGAGGMIGPGATLIFEIELLSVK